MNRFALFVLGNPASQPRPRGIIKTNKSGNQFIKFIDNRKADPWCRTVNEAIVKHLEQYPTPWKTLQGPVSVWIYFYLPRPKSHFYPTKNGPVLRSDAISIHRNKRDIENMAKALLDEFTEMGIYQDDRQVIDLTLKKRYSTETDTAGAWIQLRWTNQDPQENQA